MEPLTLESVADLYVRVSTTEQAEEGYSVDEQVAKLKAYCVAMGYKVNRVAVDPGYSGASLDRPGIREVIADVKRGRCKKVIVWKLDRLSRSQKDTLILLEDVFFPNGCAFVSLNENFDTATPIGRCIVGVLAAFAQMERENIKARTMMGKHAAVKAGRYIGPCAPFGYQYNVLPDGKREIVPDPYKSVVVKEMFSLFNSGFSLADVVRQINSSYGCLPSDVSSASSWLRYIMRNPVYIGNVKISGEVFNGMHQALVSQEVWNAANDRLEKNKEAAQRGRKLNKPLLAGLIYCGYCGARMLRRAYAGSSEARYMCYSVTKSTRSMVKDENCINRKHFKVSELDEIILNEISKLAADPAAIDSIIHNPEEDKAGPVTDRLEEIEKQISRLLNLYQTGVLDLEELQPRIDELKEERRKLSDTLEGLEDEAAGKMGKTAALEIAGAFPAAVAVGDPDELHRLIAALIDRIEILNREVTIYWKFA